LDKTEVEFNDDVTLIDEASGATANKEFEEFIGWGFDDNIALISDSLIDEGR
jgi:hypothetical protein